MSKFDLISFTLFPSTEQYNQCCKDDLLQIADFFDIRVTRHAPKRDIKDQLHRQLVAQGILPDESVEQLSIAEAIAATPSVEQNTTPTAEDAPSVRPKTSPIMEAADAPVAHSETKLVLTPGSPAPRYDPTLALKLKELGLEIKKQEREMQILRLREVELMTVGHPRPGLGLGHIHARPPPVLPPHPAPSTTAAANVPAPSTTAAANVSAPSTTARDFDVSKYIKLVPPFRESEVDSYFIAFERVAAKLNWPKDMWALLLQCNLVSKAQEVYTALPIEQSLEYDAVKTAVLRAFELVPEAYRQKFRNHTKTAKQTFVEFAREKEFFLRSGVWPLTQKILSNCES